jgi:AraC-like DNA-binding protein
MRLDNPHLILLAGGFARCSPAWTKGPTGIDRCFKVYAPVAGSARIETDAGVHRVRPGRVAFISGFRLRRQVCDRRLDVYWIHFVPESLYLRFLLDRLPPVVEWPRGGGDGTIEGMREAARLFDAPRGRLREDAPPARVCRVQGFLLGLVARLLEGVDDAALRRFSPRYYRLKPALDFMQARARETPPLREIAAQVHLAPNYFHRRFRALFGTTPFEYMLAARLDAARHLLASTDLSVKEVADRAGYENPLYFSRVFAGALGVSPTAFRALHQGAGLEGGARDDDPAGPHDKTRVKAGAPGRRPHAASLRTSCARVRYPGDSESRPSS